MKRSGNEPEGQGKADRCRCVQYFDGFATFEEISYRTGLPKRELDILTRLYADHVSPTSLKGNTKAHRM